MQLQNCVRVGCWLLPIAIVAVLLCAQEEWHLLYRAAAVVASAWDCTGRVPRFCPDRQVRAPSPAAAAFLSSPSSRTAEDPASTQDGHPACHPLPPVPNASTVDNTTSEVPHLGFAEYLCDEGFTVEGTSHGNRSFRLQCLDGYFAGYETMGCAAVGAGLWPTCAFNESMDDPDLDVKTCHGIREGGSCVARCAPGHYSPQPGRYSGNETTTQEQELPALLLCQAGLFHGRLPTCLPSPENRTLEFDVYAFVDSAKGQDPPTNVNVYDLEGLLQSVYTTLLYFQQVLAEDPNLSRDASSGAWVGQLPRLPISRDEVDTAVWYRMQVRNPSDLPARLTAGLEFGVFADFTWGSSSSFEGAAQSKDAQQLFQGSGGVVGMQEQFPGFLEVAEGSAPPNRYKEDDGKTPRADPRYIPAGRFAAFSLPGACPNLPVGQKVSGTGGAPNASCTRTVGGHFLGGGLCPPGRKPDGSAECTFALEEVARVPLDDITGISEANCEGGTCKSLRDFQVHCIDDKLRNGVRINGSQLRECTEHAVPVISVNATTCNCSKLNVSVPCGQVWNCLGECSEGEASLPALAQRCNAHANAQRILRVGELFQRAAAEGPGRPSPPLFLQDCGDHFPQFCTPDTLRGLNYCERDAAGLCGSCFVPNTTRFDPARVKNLFACREDLFSGGGYSAGGKPVCSSSPEDFTCCKYLGNCPRAWKAKGDWSACGGGVCGEALQRRPMTCPLRSVLGDCRRDLGDPGQSGFCQTAHGEECFEAQICRDEHCPWLPYCTAEGAAAAEDEVVVTGSFCLPQEWGPVDSACAWGLVHRYKRCSQYHPEDPATKNDSALLCAQSALPVSQHAQLVPERSRIQNCALCPLVSGPCQKCVSDVLFDSSRNCDNRQPIFELQLHLTMGTAVVTRFRGISFATLGGLVAQALGDSGVWTSTEVTLLDAFSTSSLRTGEVQAADHMQAWVLLVGLQQDTKRPVANASAQVTGGAVNLAVRLEAALESILREPVHVTTGDLTLYCPGMQRALTPWSSCGAGGFKWWIVVVLILVGVLCLLALGLVARRYWSQAARTFGQEARAPAARLTSLQQQPAAEPVR